MFKTIPKVAALSLARRTAFALLISYAALTTVLLVKLRPEPILIGIDRYGTRIIRDPKDSLLKKEKENFVKLFLANLYNYDQDTFRTTISKCGDFMTVALWEAKSKEFDRIAEELRTEKLSETMVKNPQTPEIRQIDDFTFEADIEIKVLHRFKETSTKLRLQLKIRPSRRAEPNPYPYEVEQYDEQQVS